jgi:hypothetical protein
MGIVGKTVSNLTQRLRPHHGGSRGLFRQDIGELGCIRGLGRRERCRYRPLPSPQLFDGPFDPDGYTGVMISRGRRPGQILVVPSGVTGS